MASLTSMRNVVIASYIGAILNVVWTQNYPDPLQVDCADGYCLVLFRADNNRNWQHAYDDCYRGGLQLQMLPILTSAVQDRARIFLESVFYTTNSILVWVAGRLKNDDVWRYVDGTADNSGVPMIPGDSGQHCVYIRCADEDLEFNTDNCAEENAHQQIICQTPADHYSSAGPYNILSGDYSYRIVDTTDDWFSARTLCVQDGGDLIHSNILDSNLRQTICDRITPISGIKRYWVGLTKYPWIWDMLGQEPKPITYFSWAGRSDRQDSTDACITLRTSLEYQWLPQPCTTQYTPYFLCANGTIPGIPSMITTRTTSSTAATSPTGTPSPAVNTPTPTTSLVSTTPAGTEPPCQSTSTTVSWALFGTTAVILLVSVIMNLYQWRSQTQSPADKPDHNYVNVPDQRPNPVTRPVTNFRGHSGNTDTPPDTQYLELDARSRDPDPAPEQQPAVYMTVGGDNEQDQVPSADGTTYDYEEIRG